MILIISDCDKIIFMRYWQKCVIPETRPDITFDKSGVCDACRSAEIKEKIDWISRKKAFEKLIEKLRNKSQNNYDCVVPVSGGKDSHYQTYVCKVKYGLNPLLVSFEPTPFSVLGEQNLLNIGKTFGCDIIHFRKNPTVYVKLARIGFERVGDHEWPNHVGIFTTAARVAMNFKIPLIVWGENAQLEYGGPQSAKTNSILDRKWMEEFGGLLGNRTEDMIGVNGLTKSDLLPYTYPSEKKLSKAKITGIFLGNYFKWNSSAQSQLMTDKYGFKVKNDKASVESHLFCKSLDDETVFIHDYLKFVKYGFDRVNDQVSIEIRDKRMEREKAVKIVRKYTGKMNPVLLRLFLEHYGYSKTEFYRIADSFTNKSLFETDKLGKLVRDVNYDLIPRYLP